MDGLFIMDNSIKMEDLGVHLFLETPICWNNKLHRFSFSIPSSTVHVSIPYGKIVGTTASQEDSKLGGSTE